MTYLKPVESDRLKKPASTSVLAANTTAGIDRKRSVQMKNMKSLRGLLALLPAIIALVLTGCPDITKGAPDPTVTSVEVSPATISVVKGRTATFRATVTGTNNPAETVTWFVHGSSAGTGISEGGVLTVAADESDAPLIVMATSAVDTTKSGMATVTVEIVTVQSVTVSPAIASVTKGSTQQFSATVSGTNNPAQTVTWSVGGGNSGTSISDGGVLNVAASESADTLTVTAISTEDPTKSGTATVAIEIATVQSVTVSPPTASVTKGSTQQFSATVSGTNNPAQTVTWSVDGGSTGTSISDGGVLTVAIDESAPTLTVTATSTIDTAKSGSASVTVVSATVQSVTVSPPTASLERGATQTFTATVQGTNNPAQTVTWSVSGGGTGTSISADGVLTVAANESAPTLTVMARSAVDTAKSGTATVTIVSATVQSVTVSPPTASLERSATQTFTATVQGTNNPAQTVTWSVSGGGTGTSISTGGVLTVAANESAATLTVTASSTVDTTKSGTAVVTITRPTVTSVTISPDTVSVIKGSTQQFSATVSGTNNLAQTVTWSVDGGSAGTSISDGGVLVVAIDESAPTLTVTASSSVDTAKSGTATVTIVSATVQSVTVSPPTASLERGATQTFTATVQGTNNPAQTVTWSVSGGGTGTSISGDGVLTVATNESAATLTVTAISTEDPTKSGTAVVIIPAVVNALDLTALVIAPTVTATPVTTAIDTAQYTGSVEWCTSGGTAFSGATFAANTVYKALVTLSAKSDYTFTGVAANSFTYTSATVSNAANSGTVTITFPATLGSANITVDFNYGEITITGSDGVNTISKSGAGDKPISLTLNAVGAYTDVVWYVDGARNVDGVWEATGDSVAINAAGYLIGRHTVTFTGKRDGKLFSQLIPFVVVE
jgi:uncharacterized protein YjdB